MFGGLDRAYSLSFYKTKSRRPGLQTQTPAAVKDSTETDCPRSSSRRFPSPHRWLTSDCSETDLWECESSGRKPLECDTDTGKDTLSLSEFPPVVPDI